RRPRRAVPVIPSLAETSRNQFDQGRNRGRLVGTIGTHNHPGTLLRGEHHHTHDALAVHRRAIPHQFDAALEPTGELDELRSRSRVQSQLVGDAHFLFRHCNPPMTRRDSPISTNPYRIPVTRFRVATESSSSRPATAIPATPSRVASLRPSSSQPATTMVPNPTAKAARRCARPATLGNHDCSSAAPTLSPSR